VDGYAPYPTLNYGDLNSSANLALLKKYAIILLSANVHMAARPASEISARLLVGRQNFFARRVCYVVVPERDGWLRSAAGGSFWLGVAPVKDCVSRRS
jgi:hypothetical protein